MKPVKSIVISVIMISIILFLFIIINCFSPPPPYVYLKDQTDPYYCLWNLQVTYNKHDVIDMIKNYKNILAGDNYHFYFDPKDIGKHPPGREDYIIPDSWGFNEDWQSTQNMFNNAYSILLTMPNLGQYGDDKDKDAFYNQKNPQFNTEHTECTVNDVDINLLVYVNNSQGYQAIGKCDFRFKFNINDNKWYMTEWHDHTAQ